MKINKNSEASAPSGGVVGFKRPQSIAEMREAEQYAEALKGSFVPELRLMPDERTGLAEKIIRVLHDGNPLAVLAFYFHPGLKKMYVAPEKGERDLFLENGFKPTTRYIYEVVDREGYFSKKTNKMMKDVVCFFPVAKSVQEQLKAIEAKRGNLSNFDICVTKSGKGKETRYQFLPEPPSPLGVTVKSLSEDFWKYYAPITQDQQLAIFGRR